MHSKHAPNPILMKKLIGIILIALCLIACSSERRQQKGSAASLTSRGSDTLHLLLEPKDATRKMTLRLIAVGFELADAKIEWLVNGRSFTTLVPTQFDGADTAKRDTIQAKAVVQGREIASNVVQIVNAPPEIASRVRSISESYTPAPTQVP